MKKRDSDASASVQSYYCLSYHSICKTNTYSIDYSLLFIKFVCLFLDIIREKKMKENV